MFALLTAALVLVVAVGVGAAYLQARRTVTDASRTRALSVAQTIARSPEVVAAAGSPDPSRTLQPYAERIRHAAGVDFVTIMTPGGIRWTHPNPKVIGQPFAGHIAPAQAGRPLTETYTGTLGPSVRAVVPVFGAGGRVVALVSVGITLESVGSALARQVPVLLVAGGVLLATCAGGAGLLARRLRRQTAGLRAAELTRMAEFYDAVLHAVREGLVLVDREGRVQLINDEGRRLLGLGAQDGDDDVTGRPVTELGLPADGRRVDELHLARDRVLVVSRSPARDLGAVVTFRDHTDMLALTGELTSARGLAESLRSQAHESANRLHTVVTLIELGQVEQALEFATVQLADAQELTDRVIGAVREPVLAALLLGKAAEAAERGVRLVPADDLDVPEDAIDGADLVTVVGNLLDNALDAALLGSAGEGPAGRSVVVSGSVTAGVLTLRVANSGPPIDPEHLPHIFERDWSTKADAGRLGGRGLGLALVRRTVERRGGTVRVTSDAAASPTTVFEVELPLQLPVGQA